MAEEKTSFISHLEELRKRLIICIAAIAVGFTICCFFDQQLIDILTQPLKDALPPGTHLIFTGVSEAFFAYLKVSFFAGIILACPVILYEIWCFIAPGLYNKEKKYVFPFVLFSTILFVSGVLFAYYVVLPITYKFFMSYTTDTIKPFPSLREYLSFSSKMLLAFGVTFELPIFILFLSKIGLLSLRTLTAYRKYAILIIFIVAAVVTPSTDVVSQVLTALPLWVLYEISIVLVKIFNRKKGSPQEAS
jgi:sec-independent protein translocase protein TatC